MQVKLESVEHDLSLTALVAGTVKINLTNLSTSKTFAEVHVQNLHHATLLKAVLLFSEEFQCGLFAEIY